MEPVSTHVVTQARPVRTAFLLPLGAQSHSMLDAAIETALSWWGGRFTLMVPCVDGEPLAAFRPWLEAFDPDLIYAYSDLTEAQERHYHEWLCPSELRVHPTRDGSTGRFHPQLPFQPLAVGTVVPGLGAGTRMTVAGPPPVIELHPALRSDPFFEQNFVSSLRLQSLVRQSLSSLAVPLAAVPLGADLTRIWGGARPPETIEGAEALLRRLAAEPRIRTAAQLAASLCPRWVLPHPPWASSFHLVIGDTVEDRLLFWNARFFYDAWRDGDSVELYVPPVRFAEPGFVAALAIYLSRRNEVGDTHMTGPPRVTLRSISQSADALSDWAAALRALLPGQPVGSEAVPSLTAFAQLPRHDEGARFELKGYGDAHSARGSALHLTPAPPDHLRYVPPELNTPMSGHWAVDLDIARSENHSPYANMRDRWRLPRRLRVTHAFRSPYHLSHPHQTLTPRVTRSGLLTLLAEPGSALPTVTLPTDRDAIRTGLQGGRAWVTANRSSDPYFLPQLCYQASPSDAGQHFFGAFQLLGSLNVAGSLLLHRFWDKQLDRFGATDQRSNHRHPDVLRRIEKRLGNATLDLRNDSHRETLANLILLEADADRMTVPSLSWDDLVKDFEPYIQAFIDSVDAPGRQEAREAYRHELRRCVERFCAAGILHQGYELRCQQCLHRNWVSVDSLAIRIPCHVCQRAMPAPLDQPWQFRLNGFLREALQRHGVRPLFWVLNRYQRRGSGSLWFEGPLNIFFDEAAADARRPSTDVDLTIIENGRVIMCEAKQSVRAFDKPVELAEAMKRLRPDVAMVAVMERSSPKLLARFAAFEEALRGADITPELMTLDEDRDFEDTPGFRE